MQHTLDEIIQNQEVYKRDILTYLLSQIMEAKKELQQIKTEDEYIKKEKDKLEKRFKKTKTNTYIKQLFVLHPKHKNYYAWWDQKKQEVLVIKYEEESE